MPREQNLQRGQAFNVQLLKAETLAALKLRQAVFFQAHIVVVVHVVDATTL
jgi:hypothetical protein